MALWSSPSQRFSLLSVSLTTVSSATFLTDGKGLGATPDFNPVERAVLAYLEQLAAAPASTLPLCQRGVRQRSPEMISRGRC